ncbi:MAG: hypothetical protein EPO52_17495 [Herbiconiux sp.]|uniref:hypothetical protein n=1 Tax=Herbiconiux sp. TaxID=1871186 RepID=UPI00121108F8|nr:hypothetical protein [Herbiconiux sp.]TAJ46328.1 MAG: hypothetical protein EPO52_17495 [Herbiconiux sp.]
MGELLHAGALVPATVGACCVIGTRRAGRVIAAVAALVMLAAMLDASTRMMGLPAFAWATLLVLTALVTSFVTSRTPPAHHGTHQGRIMGIHGALGLIVTAALLLVMGTPSGGGVAATSASPALAHHAGGAASGTLGAVVGIAVLAYVGFSLQLAVRLRPRPTSPRIAGWGTRARAIVPSVEVASMGVSAALMLMAFVLA